MIVSDYIILPIYLEKDKNKIKINIRFLDRQLKEDLRSP